MLISTNGNRKMVVLTAAIFVVICCIFSYELQEEKTRTVKAKQQYTDILDEAMKQGAKHDNTLTELATLRDEANALIDRNQILEAENQAFYDEVLTLKSKKYRYVGEFRISYYCIEKYPHICGSGTGMTASGVEATAGITVAADTSVIPMGTKIYIEGVGEREVQDRGGAIKGNRLDVAMTSHQDALRQSVRVASVWVEV